MIYRQSTASKCMSSCLQLALVLPAAGGRESVESTRNGSVSSSSLLSFDRRRNGGSEKLSDLPRVTPPSSWALTAGPPGSSVVFLAPCR